MKHLSMPLLFIVLLAPATAMTLKSRDFAPGATIPQRFSFNGFGCKGANVAPHLAWSAVPRATKMLAVTMYDPDAPTGVGWVHWVLLNVPPGATSTDGLQATSGLTDFGVSAYGGPCPPIGDKPHRYIFTLYALDTKFPFGRTTTYAAFQFTIRGHVLTQAKLVGRYGR